MGSKGMNARLVTWSKKQFPEAWDRGYSNFYAMFILRNKTLLRKKGYLSMITMHGWMFISSFEKLRETLMKTSSIVNMLHLGPHAFDSIGGEVVTTTSFVILNDVSNNNGTYFCLVDGQSEAEKKSLFFEAIQGKNSDKIYNSSEREFKNISGYPYAYWMSNSVKRIFQTGILLSEISEPKQGTSTGNNDIFTKIWHEIEISNISIFNENNPKWYPATKGGDFRKWYGNNEILIDWENNGERISNYSGSAIRNKDANFKQALTWGGIGSTLGIRFCPAGFVFTVSGKPLIANEYIYEVLGYLGSKLSNLFLGFLTPNISFEVGYVARLPIVLNEEIKSKTKTIVQNLVNFSKQDWDSYETSWDFSSLPLLQNEYKKGSLEENYKTLRAFWQTQVDTMKQLEEENNDIFIKAYGL
ncbi:MAG: class I SAM-dependent DNA methyltransferase, partial [Flavobacteriaceae bacterium]|nr:class I SAM-dependent DNA methyltransferase [Flavobacteriaceae bacterium]